MKPYTYVLTFLPTGQRYYGVRYALDCTPDDLWVSYFSSSKIIHNLIEENGKTQFEFEVRRVFDDPQKAVDWERRVLDRLDVQHTDRWLNVKNGNGCVHTPESRAKISATTKGRIFTEEHRKALAKSATGRVYDAAIRAKISESKKAKKLKCSEEQKEKMRKLFTGRTVSEDIRQRIAKSNTGKKKSPETRAKISATKQRKRLERLGLMMPPPSTT